jgi:hypothetical protein
MRAQPWTRSYPPCDEGRSWEQAAEATPDQESFLYTAPGDGRYWFTVATVDQAGKQSPADLKDTVPLLKVYVAGSKG